MEFGLQGVGGCTVYGFRVQGFRFSVLVFSSIGFGEIKDSGFGFRLRLKVRMWPAGKAKGVGRGHLTLHPETLNPKPLTLQPEPNPKATQRLNPDLKLTSPQTASTLNP